MRRKLSLVFMLLALVMTLVACNNPNRETFDEAYQALNIVVPGNDPTKVINLFTVPTELRGGVTATWTSSDTVHAAITSAGGITTVNVVRPGENEEDVTVTLTAALSYEGVTGNKTFQIIILKLPETTIYTLREIRDEEVAAGTDVKIENVTVVTVDDDAYHLYDGDTAMLVYLDSQPLVNVGDHGTIVAKVAIYYDGYQLIDVTWLTSTPGQEETPVEVVLSDYWMKDIDENVEAIKAVKQDSDLFTYITFDAKVVVRSDFTGGANYQYTLVDPESESDDENFVLTYYKNQNHRDIVAYDGLMVTVVATIRELRDNRTTNATIGTIPVFSMSVASFEVGELSEEQKVAVDKGLLNLETNFVEAGTLELPEVGEFGSTIAWTFKTPADPNNVYLNLETGAVTLPADEQVEVTVVATITNGLSSDTKEFIIKIGEFPISDLADLFDSELFSDGDTIRIKGILAARNSTSSYWIQDATGGLNIYVPSALRDGFGAYTLGIELEIIGELDIYQGLYQIAYFVADNVTVTNSTPAMPDAVSITGVDFTNVALLPYQGQLVSFEGFVLESTITASSGSHISFALVNPVDGRRIPAFMHNAMTDYLAAYATLTSFVAGDPVDVVAGILGWNSNNYQLTVQGNIFTAGDPVDVDDLAAYALTRLTLPVEDQEVTANLNLPTTGLFGSTIAWTSSDETVISTTGTVVRPAEEELDAEIALGYTLSLGLATPIVGTINVVVLAETGDDPEGTLMIYEVYGGGGNSGATYKNDYVVLYNGTSLAINLAGYSIQYASATGTTWFFTTLTGTIAAGGYYLIQQAAGSGGTVDLPTPDDIGSIAMAASNGKVALVNTTTLLTGSDPSEHASVVDFVGFGSANGFEGSGATPAISNTTSAQRITLVDTNDNATDFHAVTPNLSYLVD